ncbi:MAG: domain S-box protein, partial [Steroidobacteraceae bacterium]|nr:domain S-box protein [Steroidobacteraceae bacterium]
MRIPCPTVWISLAALVGAVAARLLLDPLLGDSLPLVTLYAAVAVVACLTGHRAALAVAVLGYLACHVLFLTPRGVLDFSTTRDVAGVLAYLCTVLIIVFIAQRLRQARDAASRDGDLLQTTLASIAEAVITTDSDGRVTYLNAAAERLTGWTNDDAVGQPVAQVARVVDEASATDIENPALQALRVDTAVILQPGAAVVARDGRTLTPVEDSASPIKDQAGRTRGCVLVVRDTTDQRRLEVEKALGLASTRLLASIVESSDDAILSKSLDGTIRSWNASAQRLFGYTEAEAIGANISLIIPAERLAEEAEIIERLKQGQRIEHLETERCHRDGRRIPVQVSASPLRDQDGNVVGVSSIARDVTERRRVEQDRQRFVTLVENSTDFIGICDLDGIPIYVNPAGLQMVGLAGIEEARRTHVRDFFLPADQGRVMDELFPRVVEHGHGELEVRFRNFRTGATRWMAYKVIALADENGRRVGFATVSQDVTERRRLEESLRSLAAELSETDRRKDEFLATLAHELRNPLAPLSSSLDLLTRARGDAAVVQSTIGIMSRQTKQLVRLVDDLLDVSRITHGRLDLKKDRIALEAVLEQAVQACAPLANAAGHDVRVTLPERPLHLHADAARLIQVFANLLTNSCKYTPPGGRITVDAGQAGNYAVVTIEDTGVGIPHDKLESIFDPFTQIDREAGRSNGGLGIGLTLVKRLVEMHGGSVEACSPGRDLGSRFVVRLPAMVDDPGHSLERPPEQPQVAASRRILVVDDNEDAAATLAMLLELNGHRTLVAHDGSAALDAADVHQPDLVLL